MALINFIRSAHQPLSNDLKTNQHLLFCLHSKKHVSTDILIKAKLSMLTHLKIHWPQVLEKNNYGNDTQNIFEYGLTI